MSLDAIHLTHLGDIAWLGQRALGLDNQPHFFDKHVLQPTGKGHSVVKKRLRAVKGLGRRALRRIQPVGHQGRFQLV